MRDPAALGFRMPAEWEPHGATWLSWPHNVETWPEELELVERTLVRAVACIGAGEDVFINVVDAGHERHVARLLHGALDRRRIRFFRIPTNDAWARDHGPIFVTRREDQFREVAATIWRFNSWGRKYPPWDLDERAAESMAHALGVPIFDGAIVLEGGSIETNGRGTLVTTESCLLHPNRERSWDRETTTGHLKRFFGAAQVVWLGEGLAGDDTDGHIDDLARFVAEDVILTVLEEDPADPNFLPLDENLRRLQEVTLPDGRRPRIITLPSPRPLYVRGERMPASYANFYICNAAVLVPTFGDPADARALETLAAAFPAREVVPVPSREIIWGLGGIHCLTQQVPEGVPAQSGLVGTAVSR